MLYLKHSLTTYTEAQLQRDLQRLPQWRREKALRYRHFSGQAQCTLSYILLMEALDKEYNITGLPTFVENEHYVISEGDCPVNAQRSYFNGCLLLNGQPRNARQVLDIYVQTKQ